MSSGETRTERCNEPEWEPQELKWFRPGTVPPPGVYWFGGTIEFGGSSAPFDGNAVVVVPEGDGLLTGIFDFEHEGVRHAFMAEREKMHGEWYGPFEHAPDFGDATIEFVDEGELGDGI